jgi:hypothetical protein
MWRKAMKKFALIVLTTASILSASAAFAGYWTPYGYIPTCGYTYWGYYFCG